MADRWILPIVLIDSISHKTMPRVQLYYSSITGDRSIKHNQSQVKFLLGAKKVPYEEVGIYHLFFYVLVLLLLP